MEVLFIASLSALLSQAEQQRSLERIQRHATSLGARLFGQLSIAPYFLALGTYTKSQKFLKLFDGKIEEVKQTRRELDEVETANKELVGTNYTDMGSLLNSMGNIFFEIRKQAAAPGQPGAEQPVSGFTDGSFCRLQTMIRQNVARIFERGDEQTSRLQSEVEANRHLQYAVLIAGVLINIALSAYLWFFYRRSILERIRTIARNTEAISEKGWLEPEMGGSDEIALLDHAFHQMHKKLLKASELEKALFNNASDVIFVLDSQEKFTQMNPAGEKQWSYPLERLSHYTLSKVVLEDDQDRVRQQIDLARSTREALSFEAGVITRTGQTCYGLWSVYWSEQSRNLFCIFHDITEHRLIEEERKSFLAMMSADLHKPLSRIAAAVQELASGLAGSLPAKAKDKLLVAERNVKRLLTLVKELIQVAEMESGALELSPHHLDADDLLKLATSEVQPVAAPRKIEIKIHPSSLSAFADEDKIMQVLVNLLSNAIKFSSDNSSVEVSARADGKMTMFEVSDYGRGVPASQKELIFEKFKQVEKTDARRKAGTGLGLPICKQLVEQHGGRIGVESEPEKGSKFWFTLPSTEIVFHGNSSLSSPPSSASFAPSSNGHAARTSPPKVSPRQRSGGAASPVSEKDRQGPLPTVHEPGEKMRFPLALQGLLLIGLPLIFEIALVGGLTWSLLKVQAQRTEELQMRHIAFSASKGLRSLLDLSGQLVCDEQDLAIDYSPFEKKWNSAYEELCSSISTDARFEKARQKLEKSFKHTEQTQFHHGGDTTPAAVLDMVASMMTLTNNLNKIVEIAEEHEFVEPALEKSWRVEQSKIMICGLALNGALSLLLCIYFTFGFSRRLIIMADNTQRLSNEKSLNKLVGGHDEITDLDLAFHRASRLLIDRRQRERAVFDNCKDVLCVISKEGKIVSLNPAGESAWGVDGSKVETLSLDSIIVPDDLEKLAELVQGAADKVIDQSLELRILTPEKRPLWTLWTVTRGRGQRVSFCVSRDIEDRKQLEALRKDFLAVVSHDLRTPLTGVMGTASLIGEKVFGPIPPEAEAQVRVIEKNCDSLLELINDILDLAKLEAGQMQLNLGEVRLSDFMGGVQSACQKLSIPLRCSAGGNGESPSFVCDVERLTQAVMNLVKYLSYRKAHAPDSSTTSAGQGPNTGSSNQICIQARSLPAGIEMFIFDSAPEIPAAIKEKLFERLKEPQLKESFVNASFHAELALPLCQKIVYCHGASIDLQSRPQSNCFIIRIPRTYLAA